MLELKKLVFTPIRVKNSFKVMTEFVDLLDDTGKAKEATRPNVDLFLVAYKFFELAEFSIVAYIFLTKLMNQ
mgnify:CR=1 FL=1